MKRAPCRHCRSEETEVVGKRYALYPTGCLIFGILLASLHHLQAPIEYRCLACGKRFGRRTIYQRLGIILLGVFLVLSLARIIWG